MCDEPTGVIGDLALGCLLKTLVDAALSKPGRQIMFWGIAVSMLPFALWGVFGWWCIALAALLLAGAAGGLLILRKLHGHVVVQAPALTPQMAAQLAAKGLKPIPGTAQPALPRALRPARERLGDRLVQSITREDIEDLRGWMLSAGRKRGGRPGTGLGPRSVRLTLSRLSAAFDQALDDGKVTRNPCARVRRPKMAASTKTSWSAEEARQFLGEAAADRLHAAWLMAMYGGRREEICGARWEDDIDLAAGTWTISTVRVVVDGKVIVKEAPKSERSARTLPLPADLVAALTALHKRQAEEKLAAGEAYRSSGYVLSDELGVAVNPEWFSDEFGRVSKRAGMRRITLHEARHTANTLMEQAGVPDSIRAAWCGHTIEVNKTTYLHARPEDLAAARDALSHLYGATGS